MNDTERITVFIDQATIAIMAGIMSNVDVNSAHYDSSTIAEVAAEAAQALWKARDEYYD